MEENTYRAIPVTGNTYRIERLRDEDGDYDPIQVVTEQSGKAYWIKPSSMTRVYGDLFSTGTIDECREKVALLVENDNARAEINAAPAEDVIVYL